MTDQDIIRQYSQNKAKIIINSIQKNSSEELEHEQLIPLTTAAPTNTSTVTANHQTFLEPNNAIVVDSNSQQPVYTSKNTTLLYITNSNGSTNLTNHPTNTTNIEMVGQESLLTSSNYVDKLAIASNSSLVEIPNFAEGLTTIMERQSRMVCKYLSLLVSFGAV